MSDLDGRVVLITGGASGIGLATARVLLREGARVVLADRHGDAARSAADELGDGAVGVEADVTSEEQVERAVAAAVDGLGGLHVLVNSAGIVSKQRFLDLPLDVWRTMLDVHLTGTFLCTQIAARHMVEMGGGSVVNVSSIAAELGNPLAVHYATAKGGIRMFTRSAAVSLAASGVRVNAVGPGTTETPLTGDRLKDPEVRGSALRRIPMGRFGQADEVAELIAFLASDRAAYITGQTIYIDGGWTAQLYTTDYEELQWSRLPEAGR